MKKLYKLVLKLYYYFFPTKYTNCNLLYKQYTIWDFTYWNPYVVTNKNDCNLYIGKFCSIAQWVKIFLWSNHNTERISTYPFNILWKWFDHIKWHPFSKWDVIIGNDVWIWAGVTILSWVTIWDWAVIATWSVVTKNVEPYTIVWWVPAKEIKKRFEAHVIEQLLIIQRRNLEQEQIKKIIPILQSDAYSDINQII